MPPTDRAGGRDGMGSRAVLMVAVRGCEFHGETVAEGEGWGQGGRVRVRAAVGARVPGCGGNDAGGRPFDRLRANGSRIARATGSRGCEGGGDAPRHAPLDTGFRRYDDVGECGPASAGGDGGVGVPLRRDGRFANRPYDGVWGTRRCDRVGGEVAPPGARSPFDFPQGERTPPLWVAACAGTTRAGGPSTGSGRTVRESPVRRGVGDAKGEETPRATPLWIPAFAGMTMWGSSGWRLGLVVMEGWGSRCGGTGDSRIAPTTGCGALGDATGLAGGCPARRPRSPFDFPQGERPPRPLWHCLCGNDACGRPPWVPQAFDRLRANGRSPSGYLVRGGDGFHGVAEGGFAVVAYYYWVGH